MEATKSINLRTNAQQARNVLNYLKIIYALLEDDGVWINIGELRSCTPYDVLANVHSKAA